MTERQHQLFLAMLAGQSLTEGQHWLKAGEHQPKAVKKKKTHEVGFFFWFPLRFSDASSRSGLTDFCPHSNIYRQSLFFLIAAPGALPGQLVDTHVIR